MFRQIGTEFLNTTSVNVLLYPQPVFITSYIYQETKSVYINPNNNVNLRRITRRHAPLATFSRARSSFLQLALEMSYIYSMHILLTLSISRMLFKSFIYKIRTARLMFLTVQFFVYCCMFRRNSAIFSQSLHQYLQVSKLQQIAAAIHIVTLQLIPELSGLTDRS